MFSLPKHREFGTPITEWVEMIPNELEADAVGLWQLVPCFSADFGLSGRELEKYLHLAIEALIKRGAVPVEAPDTGLVRQDLLSNGVPDVEKVMQYLASLGREPTVNDVWFELVGG
ncbi:MAG: hypothetical protein P8015_16685 [Acidihalobacter sp.]|jgi:hypothetical protein